MVKKTSEKQIAANRRNSKKSTGPRSAKGKNVVKFNAVKHGLTAQTPVIPTTGFEEDQEELIALQKCLHEEWQPVGVMEELLVAKITSIFWRQRRLLSAEVGEIEKNWYRFMRDREEELEESRESARTSPEFFPPLKHYSSYVAGVEHLLQVLGDAKEGIKRQGYVPMETRASLERCFGANGDALVAGVMRIGSIMEYKEEIDSGEAEPDDEYFEEQDLPFDPSDRQQIKALSLRLVAGAIARYRGLLVEVRSKEEQLLSINRKASCLPSADVSDRLLRYQTALERQLNDAIRRLEKLQARRVSRSSTESSE